MLLDLSISDTTTTLIVAIVGIVVSGIVGPAVTARATRRANRLQFEQDQRAKQRDDFRTLVDEAAALLGAGVTNLRIGREAKAAGMDEPNEVKEWASQVHLLRQRLLLRRASDDAVMTSYSSVLDALNGVGSASSDDEYDQAVSAYTERMEAFLSWARSALDAPVE